ncbi:MAG: hypothetical protein J6Q26_01765 [Bacteroidales bacterium]|nr:hypothetical protein [Bacteroidales bacterium]
MKKFFKNCAMFIALAAMSLSLNAAAPGDDLTSSFANANFADGANGWTVVKNDLVTISTGEAGTNGFTTTYLKAEEPTRQFKNFAVSQTVETMPLGDYEVSATIYKCQQGNRFNQGSLYLVINGTKSSKVKDSSASGGAKTTVKTRVIDGKMEVKFLSESNNNDIIGLGNLEVIYKGAPELAPALATAETFADKKMLADYSARYAKAIAAAKAHSGVVDAEYMALCTEFETLNAAAQGSIDDFAAYAAAIAKAEAFVAASTIADKAAIEATIAEHKAQSEAGEKSPASEGWIAALELAVGEFDATYFIVNANFTDGLNGWSLDTVAKQNGNHIVVEFLTKDTLNAGINGGIFFHDNKNHKQAFKNLKLSQTVTGLPNGDYYLSMRMYADEEGNFGKGTVTLFANDKSNATKNNGELKVKVRVTDGTLNMAIESKDGRNGNFYFGNIKLQYVGFESWAKIDGNTATASNLEELIDALKDERLAGQDAVINLTAAGPYELGGSIKEYAAFKSLTIKSTAGAKVSGRITSQPVKLNSLTFDGITFVGSDATTIYFSNVDSIGVLTVKNSTFQDLGKEHIIGFRGSNQNAVIGSIIFTNNTVNNFALSKPDGGDHAFPINKGQVQNFVMTENVFNNYAGKQFLQFANAYGVVGTDSIINITVENNVFNGWGNPAGNTGSAENFIEFSNGTGFNNGVKININNNLFYKNITDTTTYRVPVLVKFAKGVTAEYLAKSEVNIVGNLMIPDSVVYKFNLDPSAETVVALPTNLKANIEAGEFTVNRKDLFQKDFPEFAYVAGEKMLQSHPMYTAGKDGKYIGVAAMYYDFAATEAGATVSTAAGLIEAMGYTFDVENPVITMLDCTDEGGVYNVGTGYKKMGANANLTIKAAAGATPVVSGTLAGANYNMESLTIEGLKFIAGGNPIQMMNAKDSIDVLTVKNCVFEQFGAEQVGLFRAANGYLGKFVFVGNIVSEYGYGKQDGGNHAFQFNQSNFTIGGLEFTENQFIEYGGKQFINFSNAAPVAGSDSIMHINFSNNTLYGFSGNGWWADAAQYRNFIEFTCGSKYKWVGADITINNNLFYELNHTCDTLGIANRLALGTDGTSETYKVKVLNNVFYPDAMMTQVELGKTMEGCNLPIFDNENIKATRNDITLETLGLTPETIWFKGEVLAIPHTSPLMKAGVDGTYVGAKANYVKDTEGIPTVAYITTDQKMGEGAAATTNDPIYNYLNEGYDFNMVLVVVSDNKKADVSADIDLTKYDVAIIAEQFAGDAAALMADGPLAINKLTIPTIYNKTYALRGDRALAGGKNYGGGADANVASIVVAKENQAWGVFDGIDFTKGDTIAIFKELTDDNGVVGANTKGINYVKGLDMLRAGKLADPAIADVSAVSACINYVPAGTTLAEGITTAAPMFIFGMNSGAISANNGENITEDGLKLWKNALNTLVGNIDETPRNLVGLKKVAYVTAEKEMAEGSEDAVLAALSADESLNVVKMFATDVNIEGFDAAIVQESLGGGDAILKPEGALGLANLSVPTIYNKLYAMKDGRAFTSVGKAATGKEAGETVLTITKTKESNLFEGVFAEGAKEAAMFVGTTNDKGAEGVKALNYAAGVENAGTQLAIPTGVADASVAINYIKAGEVLGDATLKTNVLTLGMNYGAINKPGNVTAANIQLWKNAVAIMTGAKELTIEDLPNALNAPVVLNKVFANNGVVYVNAAEAAVINVYSMTGSLVKSVEVKEGLNSINGLNAGQVYMIRCNDEVSKVIL